MLIQNGNIAKKKLQMGHITAATLPSQYQTTENPAASMGCGDDKVLGYQKILSFFLKRLLYSAIGTSSHLQPQPALSDLTKTLDSFNRRT